MDKHTLYNRLYKARHHHTQPLTAQWSALDVAMELVKMTDSLTIERIAKDVLAAQSGQTHWDGCEAAHEDCRLLKEARDSNSD